MSHSIAEIRLQVAARRFSGNKAFAGALPRQRPEIVVRDTKKTWQQNLPVADATDRL
jgi:hypothetical protein